MEIAALHGGRRRRTRWLGAPALTTVPIAGSPEPGVNAVIHPAVRPSAVSNGASVIDHLSHPTVLAAHGSPPKQIVEHVGLASTRTDALSIAVMAGPAGWTERARVPDFDEWTVVISRTLRVVHRGGVVDVRAGEAVHVPADEEVRYATPDEPAQHVSVCMPAFSPAAMHRLPDG